MTAQNMLNIKQLPLHCLYLGISLAALNTAIAPAAAQSVTIINGAGVHQRPVAGYSIYGTPVNTHRVVHPVGRQAPYGSYDPYPNVRQNVVYPTQIYPHVNYPVNTHRVVHPVSRQAPYGSYDPYPNVRQNVVYPTQIYPHVNYPVNTHRVVYPVNRQAPYGSYDPYPNVRQNVVYPTQIYPHVNYPIIRNSTIVNPVPVNNSWRHTPFRGRSRVILTYPH
jgi:hypothetical protein